MSFDISLWNVGERIGRKEAIAISAQLSADEDAVPRGLIASASVDHFRMELEDTYPLEPTVLCPWASECHQTRAHITLFCTFSRSAEVLQFVLPLAHRHGLSLFDDRSHLIYLPPALVESSDCTLESPCLLLPVTAYPEMVPDILEVLPTRRDPYLIIARSDHVYMQTCWTKAGFVLEFRDGNAQAHYRASNKLDADSAARIIQQYVRNAAWRTATTFEKVEV